MGQGPRTLTLWQVRAVCTQREPTGGVIIVIVAGKEEREDKRAERREREEEKERRKNDGRVEEEGTREREELPVCSGKTRACVQHARVLPVHTEAFLTYTWRRLEHTHGRFPRAKPRYTQTVRLVLARLLVVFASPLHFHGRMVVLRNMFIPGALHGIEASFLAESCVRKLRAAFCKVSWSRRQPLAHVGAVLSLLDGRVGCDPAFLCGLVSFSADA